MPHTDNTTTEQVTVTGGKRYIPAKFDLSSINTDKRTVDVVFATEREVMMYNWREGGLINEVLVCDDTAGDLSRLNNGGPLCDSHRTYSVRDGLGVVEKAWFAGGKARATVRFSKRADVESVWQDVQDGIVSGISVGYRVNAYEVTEKPGQVPMYRAVKWEGLEISLALVQADPGSAVGRSAQPDNTNHTITIIHNNKNNNPMPDNNEGTQPAGSERTATATQPAPPAVPDAKEIRKQERQRIDGIRTAARVAGVTDAAFITELVNSDKLLDEARGLIIDKAAAADTNASTNVHTAVTVTADETDKFRTAAIHGMCLRSGKMNENNFKPDQVQAAREFRGMSLRDAAIECLIRTNPGVRDLHRLSTDEVYKRTITSSTSDFPILLEGAARSILLAAYNSIPDTWRKWCKVGSVNDFRSYNRKRLGALTRLDSIGEDGEIKNKSISDATKETVQIETFANMVTLSREMMINDDLNGFARIPHDLGRAAARGIEVDAYALLASNPLLSDGYAIFSSQHANLGTGGAQTIATWDEIRVLMAKQKDPNSQDYIGLKPKILLVDTTYLGISKILNASTYDPEANTKLQRPNMVFGMFSEIVDSPRINGTAYYAFCEPEDEPVIEVNFLNGVQTPVLESQQSFEQLGMRWRIYFDYGVDAVGFRGAVKNAGS